MLFNQTLKITEYTVDNICVLKGFEMFKNNLFTRAVSLTVMGAFAATLAPQKAQGQMLVPISFSQMYYLAQNGQVEALRGSVRRGMNIDVMNQNGDTGLCIAARRRDSYTYNAFRAAGANPRHPCTQTIYGYEDFVNSAGTAPISGTSRAAYGMMGKEEYKIAPWVWWAAGAALVGGGIALALGGGGGGGKGSSGPSKEKIDSAGKFLAQNGSVMHTAGSGERKENSSNLTMSNDKESVKTVNFNEDVTNNSKDLNVILRATGGGTYQNSKNTDLNASRGVVAMSAYDGSSAANSGALNVSANNAAIGMLAGDHSSAYNNGTDANGIHLTFKGYEKTNSIIGMYGDAGSSIVNNGLVDGTASLTSEESGTASATKGSMTGMELMIINANTDSSSTVSKAINSGTIDLVAGQHSSITPVDSVEVSLIGMGSYLDNGFLNGSKNIKRGEKAEITNENTINLSYFGKYAAEYDYIQNGTGGIVGIKSDANTVAVNNGKININMSTTDTGSQSVAAGMQSVHGGTITNSATGEINLTSGATDSRVTYGMVAVKGNGTVSGLGNISPVVTNNGTITLAISNAYGMAAHLGGTLKNNNTIILGAKGGTEYTNNVGMYGTGDIQADMTNVGNIHIYSNNSTGIKNNYPGATTITNTGTITIEKSATGSHPFAGSYSNIVNSGTIDYRTTPNTNPNSGSSSGSSSSSQSASAFPDTLAFTLKDAVINTDGNNTLTSASVGTSASGETSASKTNKVINDGIVSLTGSSYTAAIANNSALGEVINNNTINLNDRGDGTTVQSVGIYATSSTANGSSTENNGTIYINTQKSAGMISASTADRVAIINTENGKIVVNNEESVGMFTAKGSTADIKNYGVIEVKKKNSYAIISNGSGKICNYNTILLSDDEAVAFYIGKDSTSVIAEYGTVEVTEGKKDTIGMRIDKNMTLTELLDVGDDIPEDFIYYEIGGNVIMDFSGGATTTGTSTFARTVNGGTLTIESDFATGKDGQVLFKGLSGSTTINNANLDIQHKDAIGISITGSSANATNAGSIEISGLDASGMYATNGATVTNTGTMTPSGASSYTQDGSRAIHAIGQGAKAVNDTNGIINVGSEGSNKYRSAGIVIEDGAKAENNGIININDIDSYGIISSTSGVSTIAENLASGEINASAFGAYGMISNTHKNSSVRNFGTIRVSGKEARGLGAKDGGTATNASGTIIVSGLDSFGMYAQGNGSTATNSANIKLTETRTFGMRSFNGGDVVNEGTIDIAPDSSSSSSSVTNVIGMHANTEFIQETEQKSAPATATNKGTINVGFSASFGMVADEGDTITNGDGNGSGVINVSSTGSSGMYAHGGNTTTQATATNKGTINILEGATNSYGMLAYGAGATATNESGATIIVKASNSYGMYAINGATITNKGTIIINDASSYGMLATGQGSTATNTNNNATHIYMPTEDSLANGLVGQDGGTATGKAAEVKPATLSLGAPKTTMMMASNSGKIINSGLITTNSALDFTTSTDDTSSVNIANGGSFEALSFSGNVVADSDITLGGFENEYTNKNSFVGEDMGLNITSGSYLFNADKALNDNGNTDVVMSKKDFADVVENSSLADFLENNYAEKNNENLFNSLKSAENSAQFNQNLNDLFGNNLMSNLTFEDLNTLREMNFAMNDNLTEQKKGTFSLADGVEIVKGQKFGSSSHYALNGYSDGKTSVAVGLAVADVRADNKSKYSNKLDKNIMLSMPVSHKTHGFELITSPKLGYARGSYEREGLNGENYDGAVERKTFALMNEARYPFKLNGVKIVPNAEFNMIGFNVKGREDTKQYSLNIDSQNHYSVESGVGFNLEKEFMPNKDSVLKISGGMSFYKEFADPYDLKVGMNEMNGNYKLKDEKHGDKRTVLRFGAGYNIKENLDISAILRTNIDREYRTDTGLSLNYHF